MRPEPSRPPLAWRSSDARIRHGILRIGVSVSVGVEPVSQSVASPVAAPVVEPVPGQSALDDVRQALVSAAKAIEAAIDRLPESESR